MDTPELDRRRDELRCQGLKENLAKLGVEISFEDLADGLRASTPWLAAIWKRGGQVSTFEQIRYIVNHATRNQAIRLTEHELLIRLEESYRTTMTRPSGSRSNHPVSSTRRSGSENSVLWFPVLRVVDREHQPSRLSF